MGKEKYTIVMSNELDKVRGKIIGTDYECDFDPLTVLCDLKEHILSNEEVERWTFNEEKEVFPIMVNYKRFSADYYLHPFFRDKRVQRRINKYIKFDNQSTYFNEDDKDFHIKLEVNTLFILVDEINEAFTGKNVNPIDFEMYKTIAELKYNYTVDYYVENPWFTDREAILEAIRESKIMNPSLEPIIDKKSSHVFQGLSCTSITNLRELREEYYMKGTPLQYTYECYSVEEMIYCVWHYLVSNKYKSFIRCDHCGKLVATNNGNKGYCHLMSPYEGYENDNCRVAVEKIRKKLYERKRTIDKRLANSSHSKSRTGEIIDNLINDFKLDNADYTYEISEKSSVENLRKWDKFLNDFCYRDDVIQIFGNIMNVRRRK